jgi:hypothetical protein
MPARSRFSDPDRPDSVFERAASWPGNFMETQFNNMVGDRPMTDAKQDNFFSNVGKGIENFAAGGVNGANDWIRQGSEKLRGDDWIQKMLGMVQMIAGNLGKIALPVLGMAPTAVSNVSSLISETFGGKKDKETPASPSIENASASNSPSMSSEHPTPGGIPSVKQSVNKGM